MKIMLLAKLHHHLVLPVCCSSCHFSSLLPPLFSLPPSIPIKVGMQTISKPLFQTQQHGQASLVISLLKMSAASSTMHTCSSLDPPLLASSTSCWCPDPLSNSLISATEVCLSWCLSQTLSSSLQASPSFTTRKTCSNSTTTNTLQPISLSGT